MFWDLFFVSWRSCLNIFFRGYIASLRRITNDIITIYWLLLYDIKGSESFDSELARPFPFAAEFWNNSSRALQFPLAFFNKLRRSCYFCFLEGIFMTTNDLIRKKARKLKHILWKGEMVVPFRYLIKDPSSLYQFPKTQSATACLFRTAKMFWKHIN